MWMNSKDYRYNAVKKHFIIIGFAILVFLLYGNSINNEYAIDDNNVVEGVQELEQGLASIPKLFTRHYIVSESQSFSYRPLVSASFALEKQFFNELLEKQSVEEKAINDQITQANISHFINVLLYALTIIFMYKLLLLVFSDYNKVLPILITLIFLIHPAHTEPIANIKSRDELLMFLGLILGLYNYLKFSDTFKYKYLFYGCVFTLLSLLSKKTGIAIIGILPVMLYFRKGVIKTTFLKTIFATIIAIAFFVGLKNLLIDEKAFSYHYFFENHLYENHGINNRVLTAISCAWFYLKMLIYPENLSFYYGYNQVEIFKWTSIKTYVTLLIYLSLGIYAVMSFIKRKVIGLGLVLWFGVLLGYLNLISIIPGIVADRFLYIISFGFSIVIAMILLKIARIAILNKGKQSFKTLFFILIPIFMLASYKTISRNENWENYLVLFSSDIAHLSNSAKANSMIGDYLWNELKNEQDADKKQVLVNKVLQYYNKSIAIYPEYFEPNNNLGTLHFMYSKDYQKAEAYFEKAIKLNPESTLTQYNLARCSDMLTKYQKAEKGYRTIIESNEDISIDLKKKAYSYLSLNYIRQQKYRSAALTYQEAMHNFPAEAEYPFRLANLHLLQKDTISALNHYEKVHQLIPQNKQVIEALFLLHGKQKNNSRANYYKSLLNASK